MATPSTPISRNLRTSDRRTITDIPIRLSDGAVRWFRVDPAVVIEPGIQYRLDLDAETETATITEIASEGGSA